MASRRANEPIEWPEWAGKKPHKSNDELVEILERRHLSREQRGRATDSKLRLKKRLRKFAKDEHAGEPAVAERHREEIAEGIADPADARVREGDGILGERVCAFCNKSKPIAEFRVVTSGNGRSRNCNDCFQRKNDRLRNAIAVVDTLPAPVMVEPNLSIALVEGAAEAISYLRAVVERGHKALLPSKVEPRVFTTLTTCATAAAKALANLQLRVNEAAWRAHSGSDVLGDMLKRVEEAELRATEIPGIPARHAPPA